MRRMIIPNSRNRGETRLLAGLSFEHSLAAALYAIVVVKTSDTYCPLAARKAKS